MRATIGWTVLVVVLALCLLALPALLELPRLTVGGPFTTP